MENTYFYGGFIQTGGKLQDGTPWAGINIMIARHQVDDKGMTIKPVVSTIAKARYDSELLTTLANLRPGALVDIYFDERGKVALFKPKGVK